MKILGKDCGCQGRKRWLRRLAWKLVGKVYGFGEHLTIMEGHLTARVRRADGSLEEYDLGYNTITDAAVAFMVDDFDGGVTDISNMGFNAWGTGACTIPPTCPTTALVTEASEARVLGTKSQPTANQYRTVAQITADGAKTITEWGLFSQLAVGGTAWSLRCFTGIGLALNDVIEFTYTLTINCITG